MAIDDPQTSAVVVPPTATVMTDNASLPAGVAPASVNSGVLKVAIAGLVQAIAGVVGGRVFLGLFALTWTVLLFGADRIAGWIEAIGAGGVMRFFGVAHS